MKTNDISIEDEAGSAKELFEKISKNDFDVVLLDISLPDNNGLEIIKKIKKRSPLLQVLVHTMHPEDQLGILAYKAGASGFLNKASDTREIIEAIRNIASGKIFWSDETIEKVSIQKGNKSSGPLHGKLSTREMEVMSLLVSGKTKKEIGNLLNLNPKTISTYHSRLLEKMGMKSDAEIIAYSIRNKLFEI